METKKEGLIPYCLEGGIEGAIKFGNAWAILENAEKPKDERIKTGKYIKRDKHYHVKTDNVVSKMTKVF